MTRIVVDVDLGRTFGAVDSAAGSDAALPPVDNLDARTEAWVRRVLEPYAGGTPDRPGRSHTVAVSIEVLGQPAEFDLHVGPDLLADLAETYAAFGWDAVSAATDAFADQNDATRRFLAGTQDTLAMMILDGLTRVEELASQFAKERWTRSRTTLQGYLTQFTIPVGFKIPHPEFADRNVEKQVLALCREYSIAAAEAVRLGEKVAQRRKGAFRTPGTGWYLWFEVYAAPQRTELAKMEAVLPKLNAVCPAAILILDDLPDELKPNESAPYAARIALPEKILTVVGGLLSGVEELLGTLSKPRGTAVFSALMKGTDPSAGRLAHGGIEQGLLDLLTTRARDELLVMSNPTLLDELANSDADNPPLRSDSWESAVLYQYRRRLALVIEEQQKQDETWQTIWRWLGRLTALLALVALLAFFPFGDLAAGSALATILGVAARTAAALSLLMLFVHTILGQLQLAWRLEEQARDQIFRLFQSDPEALREVGTLVSRSAVIRRQLGQGLLQILIEAGLSRFKIVAQALDLADHIDNFETLFTPEPTADGA
jgi:hypothetical protein